MLHIQHHILCNISYVVIAESMEKSLKYTTSNNYARALRPIFNIPHSTHTLNINNHDDDEDV